MVIAKLIVDEARFRQRIGDFILQSKYVDHLDTTE
jgi:hypothetical protein